MPTTYPPSAAADASNRAWRTFFQGLFFDVLATVVAMLVVAVTDVEWTSTYWIGVASLVGKTVVVAVISYMARTIAPPAVSR
jgi:hypothetical protein